MYQHHGIYVGRRSVIHYSGWSSGIFKKGPIEKVSIDKFIGDWEKIGIVEYEIEHNRDEIIQRAYEAMEQDLPYNLFEQNCEHFATYCVTGNWHSKQIHNIIWSGLIGHFIKVNGLA